MIDDVIQIFGWAVPNAAWIGVVIYLITHPEVAQKWGAVFNSWLSRISSGAERRAVALDIQGRIDSFSKSMNTEVAGIMPYGVKIQWVVGETTKESFFKDNKVILRMGYHTNQDENVVRTALEYVAKGMLPDARSHVDGGVAKSADLIMTKKLLEKERRSALQYYYGEVLNPATKADKELDRYVSIMHGLDQLGYFTRILLRELQLLGVTKQFSIPEQSTKEETKKFVDFLDQKVVRKPPKVDVDPTFVGESMVLSIVYVAKTERIGPHLGWIKKCIKKNMDRIYICARGAYNISLVRRLQERLKSNPRLSEIFCDEFATPQLGSRRKDNICIRYDIGKNAPT